MWKSGLKEVSYVNKNKLKEQLKHGRFYIIKDDLYINAKINLVLEDNNEILSICFEGGVVDVTLSNLQAVRRPGNLIAEFKWCYVVRNSNDHIIGYIGEKENQ